MQASLAQRAVGRPVGRTRPRRQEQRRPRSARAQAAGGARNPWDHLDGSRGPVRPAEVADESPAPDALSDEQEQVLLLQSAINKTYRHKLLEFRRSVTPDMLDGMRATMPPELVPELDALLREAAALSDDEVAEFEAATAAAEAAAAVAGAAQAVVEADAVTGPGAAGDGLMFEDDPSQQAGPYSLSPEEHAAWQMIQDPNLPEDFMSYLADMLPENTSEVEVQQLLDRLPDGVVGELQELFFELKEFEASDESDMEAISKRYMDLTNRMDRLMEDVEQQEAAAWEATRQLQQPGAPLPAQSSGSASGSAPTGRFIGPALPPWQEARQQQQQQQQRGRRALAASS